MAEAGLTRGSVYCYFSSKSDLYAQSAARVIHEDRENPARADKIMHDHLSDMDQDRRYIPDDRVAERHFAHRSGGQSGIRVRAQLADLVVRASSQRQSRSAAATGEAGGVFVLQPRRLARTSPSTGCEPKPVPRPGTSPFRAF